MSGLLQMTVYCFPIKDDDFLLKNGGNDWERILFLAVVPLIIIDEELFAQKRSLKPAAGMMTINLNEFKLINDDDAMFNVDRSVYASMINNSLKTIVITMNKIAE